MVPLKDENPIQITPIVTYVLITANIVIFIYQLSLGTGELQGLLQNFAFIPDQLSESLQGSSTGDIVPEPLTLVTSQFLHGSIPHVIFNMLYLWIFGNNIEEEMGHVRYLTFYLLCGVLAALTQYIFNTSSTIPTLGASGAIAGVMGAYIFRFPQAKVLTLIPLGFFWFTVRIPAIFFLGFWFLQQAFNSVLTLDAQVNTGGAESMIAYWAHAGGFVFGALLGPLFGLFSRRN
ncbi:rhomboid family intramembrane serine protease [Geitlerinema sp. P-1104]|uniref:rhomboid family intramembrane serine protease n=1 Tax=Geitlerinema sp. P-1104 TaxID=2546230 RepID=UPI0014774848|nr:rhomboid family intramembrane serine protease [Geitlerinema sp. P-1104]NMG58327.1 rhomboid family intramembrane serine protease [Geitlerinema sp. P-1104]